MGVIAASNLKPILNTRRFTRTYIYNKLNFIYKYINTSLIYDICIYSTMFGNVFSKLFGKKEKKDSKNDKKTLENV